MMSDYGQIYMFHYVRDMRSNKHPFLNAFSTEYFEKCVKKLKNNFRFISIDDAFEELRKNKKLPPSTCMLTFDDGLKDHYQSVFPILLEHNIPGLFFLPIRPLRDNSMLTVHKAHCIYGAKGYPWFIDAFKEKYDQKVQCPASYLFADPKALFAYPYDDEVVAGFKYGINFKLDFDLYDTILDEVISSEPSIQTNDFYLDKSDIKEMMRSGMDFGYHGYTHKPFSSMSNTELYQEMTVSRKYFQDTFLISPKVISYPYGSLDSVNAAQYELIKQFGVDIGFFAETVESTNTMRISRIDCVELANLFNTSCVNE